MTTTITPAMRTYVQQLADEQAGLRYREPLGPHLPGLNREGLDYVRQDALAAAAGADRQAEEAWTSGNSQLGQRCGGAASAYRMIAQQITRYCLVDAWQVTE